MERVTGKKPNMFVYQETTRGRPKSLHRLPGKPLRREAVPRKISTKQMQKKTLCEKKLLVQSHT